MSFEILPVTSEDAQDIGEIIFTAWRETYCGLIPGEILDGHSLEECVERAKQNIGYKRICRVGGEAAGVVCFLPTARDICTHRDGAEIVALYVLKKFQRKGIGKALLEAAKKALGGGRITLFVLKGNENAVGFYKAMGFEFTGHEIHDGGMTDLEMVVQN